MEWLVLINECLVSCFMNEVVAAILNNLEYFAMHFTHGTADETVVYQSLHQSYLDIVRALYLNISKENARANSKYYTNIIELYRIWSERAENTGEKLRELEQVVLKKGTTLVAN